MVKITLEVEGMACGMCEAHVNDAIRKAFPVKKVTSSHTKGKTEILAENPLDEEKLKSVIAATGYTVRSAETAPYVKRGFSLLGRWTETIPPGFTVPLAAIVAPPGLRSTGRNWARLCAQSYGRKRSGRAAFEKCGGMS